MRTESEYIGLLRRNRAFRRLWVGQLISLGGDWFSTIALLGLVNQITGSSFVAGVVLAANRLPVFFLSPIAGVIVDRFNRKRLMIAADLIRAVIALGMILVRSRATVWIGVASMAGITAFSSVFSPASQAAIPNLVSEAELVPANVLMGASFGVMLAAGSALGGLVAATFGRTTAFVANSVSFLASAALISGIRAGFSSGDRSQPVLRPLRDFREGVAHARSDGRLLALLATKGGFGLGAGVIVLLSVFATRVLHGSDATIGALFAARGAGVLLGPILVRRLVRRSEQRLFLAIGVSMVVFGLAYAALPAVPYLWGAMALVTTAHLGGGSQWMLSSYGLQQFTPDWVRGRIFSFDAGLLTLTISFSLLAAGWAAQIGSIRAVVLVFALIEVGYAALWLARTRRWWRPHPAAPIPSEPADTPEPPLMGQG